MSSTCTGTNVCCQTGSFYSCKDSTACTNEGGNILKFICETYNTPSLDHTLNCTYGVIDVKLANYGRTSQSICAPCRTCATCGSECSPAQFANTACYSDQTKLIKNMCDDKSQCSINATKANFDDYDPCIYIYKYLNVSYVCKFSSKNLEQGIL